ncbi:MAG: flagellar hook-associated protein FlgL [Anaerohalosphaeraceae bacterium]
MSFSLDAIYKNTSWAINQHSSKLALLQEKAGTGQEVNRVSDNPTVANQILGLLSDNRSKMQYMESLDEATSVLELSSSVLQSMSTQVANARSSLTSIMSGTTGNQLRENLATDLNNALEQLVSLANTQRLGQSLFAGSKDSVVPYNVERNASGEITRVIYQGSMEEKKVTVANGVEMSAVLVGSNLFSPDNRDVPVFYGQTGVQAGTGTSTVRGDIYLQVQGSAGSWQLSIDGGQNWVNATGTETNLPVVNSQTGEVLYLDVTMLSQSGTEPIRVTGTYDIFNSLISARDQLENAEEIPEAQLKEMLNDIIDEMQVVEQKLTSAFPVVGGRVQTLTALRESIEEMKLNTSDDISRMQDADISQVAIDLARYEVLYQMSLSVASKMFSMSFLDFMK